MTDDNDHFLFNLKKVLSVVNDPLFDNHLFWNWLSELSDEKVQKLYAELKEQFEETGN